MIIGNQNIVNNGGNEAEATDVDDLTAGNQIFLGNE